MAIRINRTMVVFCLLCFAVAQFCLIGEAEAKQRPTTEGGQTESQERKGERPRFVDLLENKDFSNFRGYQTEALGEGWKIEGKTLVFDGTGRGDLITNETYDNFELQYDWNISEGGNSGVMFHVTLGDNAPYLSGPEIQILDDDVHADGKSELTSAGALYGLYAPQEKKLRPVGSWNKSRLIIKGNQVTHYLNNVKVVDAEMGTEDWNRRLNESKFKNWEKFGKSTTGHIAFQNHGNAVKFRNIRVKRLVAVEESGSAKE